MVNTLFIRTLSFFGIPVPKHIGMKIVRTGLILIGIIAVGILALKALGIADFVDVLILGVPTNLSLWTMVMIVIFWMDSNLYIRKFHTNGDEVSYTFATVTVSLFVIFSVVVHEMGHGFAATFFGNNIDGAGLSWWGAFVRPTASIFEMSPWEEIIVALAGPFTNILLGALAAAIVKLAGESLSENTVQYFSVINFRLAKFNLFPAIIVLDGGKALEGLLRLFGVGENQMWWTLLTVGWLIFFAYRWLTRNVKSLEDRIATL